MTRTNQRRQHLIDGNGNAVPFSKNDDRLIEGSDFRGSPGFNVLEHAAGVFGGLFQHGPETRFKGWFVGQVMKATQGKANPKLVNEVLRKKLEG